MVAKGRDSARYNQSLHLKLWKDDGHGLNSTKYNCSLHLNTVQRRRPGFREHKIQPKPLPQHNAERWRPCSKQLKIQLQPPYEHYTERRPGSREHKILYNRSLPNSTMQRWRPWSTQHKIQSQPPPQDYTEKKAKVWRTQDTNAIPLQHLRGWRIGSTGVLSAVLSPEILSKH